MHHPVAYRPVQIAHGFEILLALSVIVTQVDFIDDKSGRHGISLGCGQKSIDKCCRCDWMIQCGHQKRLIDIGRDDMSLLRKVARTPYYVIFPRHDSRDKRHCARIAVKLHAVTDSHRICGANPLEPEIALYLRLHLATIVGSHGIEASRVSYYGSCHNQNIYKEAAAPGFSMRRQRCSLLGG